MDIVMNNVMALSICKVMNKGKCKAKINLMIMQWSVAMVEKRLRSFAMRHIKIHTTYLYGKKYICVVKIYISPSVSNNSPLSRWHVESFSCVQLVDAEYFLRHSLST